MTPVSGAMLAELLEFPADSGHEIGFAGSSVKVIKPIEGAQLSVESLPA